MKYENMDGKADIWKWLESVPESYDFVEDTQENYSEQCDFGKIEKSYDKFFIYKHNTEKENNKPKWNILDRIEDKKLKLKSETEKFIKEAENYLIGDPDSSSTMLQEIYKLLWPDLVGKRFMKIGDKIASDTMTSAMVRFTDAMKVVIGDNSNEEATDEYANTLKQISAVHTAYGGSQRSQYWWTQNFSIIVAAVLGDDFYKLISNKYYSMRCFLDKIHTVGNYCPVPAGFNGARSGAFGRHDYWDLTLQKIYEWYCTYDKIECESGKIDIENIRDNLIAQDLMHGKGNALNCVRWLETFGKGKIGWRNFVDYLYMQDYVMDAENDDYRPMLFWKEHSWDHPEISYTENCKDKERKIEIINERLQEISSRISARSIRIVNACRKKHRDLK